MNQLLKKYGKYLITILVLVIPFIMNSYYGMRLLTTAGIYFIIVIGLNTLLGYTGLVSIGQAGIFGVGAYISGLLMKNAGFSFWPTLLIALAAGILLGLFIGAITLRLESAYLAIVTLGLSLMIQTILQNWRSLTNGFEGLLKIPKPSFFGMSIKDSTWVLFVVLLFDVAIFWLLRSFLRSKYGRNLKAVRDDSIAANMMGINVVRTRLLAFTISSALAALAGCLYAGLYGALFPDYFNMDLSVLFLCIVVVGGMGSVTGSVIGGFLVYSLREWWLEFCNHEVFVGSVKLPLFGTGFKMLVFAIIILAIVLFFRKGIMGNKEFSWNGILTYFANIKAHLIAFGKGFVSFFKNLPANIKRFGVFIGTNVKKYALIAVNFIKNLFKKNKGDAK